MALNLGGDRRSYSDSGSHLFSSVWLPLVTVRQIVAAMIITLTAIALAGFLQPFVVQVRCLHGRCYQPPRRSGGLDSRAAVGSRCGRGQVDDVIAVTCHYQLLLTLLMSLIVKTGIAQEDGYAYVQHFLPSTFTARPACRPRKGVHSRGTSVVCPTGAAWVRSWSYPTSSWYPRCCSV